MLLYFDDPVSLTGCTIVPCSLVLSYATSYELVFECVTRNGEQPIDMEALGLSWSAVVTPSFSTTDKPLAKASIAADSVVGNKITVPIDTFSSNFYKYVAGRHAAPAVFSLRGYKIKDVEATCSASFQFWIQVQGRPNQDCIPDELGILSTALEKEISDRMEADDLLQQEIDQLKDSGTAGGDMTKAVYDKNDDGVVDVSDLAHHASIADQLTVLVLNENTDLNTVSKPGVYWMPSGAYVNAPAPQLEGWLTVYASTDGNRIRQELYNVRGRRCHNRQFPYGEDVWSDWSDNLDSADLSALNMLIHGKADRQHTHEIADVTELERILQELQDRADTLTEADPAVDLQFEDATLGTGWELNGTVNMLTFFDQVYQLQKLKLRVVSKDQTTIGNVVLVPIVNDVAQEAVVVPVSAALTVVEVPVHGSGQLIVTRTSEDERDTLKGESGTVGMFITNIWKVSEL